MQTRSPAVQTFLAALLGGLVVLVIGTVLIATDVIDTGDTTKQVVTQSPITEPASGRAAADGDGLTVKEIYRRDGPGVVFIQARVGSRAPDSPFGLPEQGPGIATGSGFVLDKQGFIITNAHVVEGAGSGDIQVRIGEEDPIDAKLVGSDPSTDVAVLKVDPKKAGKLAPLTLGDSSKVSVGDPAIAIGNPFGFDRTVTTGIVSALQRQIEAPNGFTIDNVIQTDASVNPGNSGGPLLDATGRVIGINSQIATGGSRGSVGIAFAVPINTAKKVVPQLKQSGEIERAFLGVTTSDVTKQLADDLNLPVDHGALVQEVVEGGPADKAGIRAGRTQTAEGLVAGGDLIVKVDGQEINEPQDVADAIADDKPGDTIDVELFRGDDRKKVRVKLGERPKTAQGLQGDQSPDDEGILPLP
jgi:S1-C subfamily serine protease